MKRPDSPDDLLRNARDAAGTVDVRPSVRKLTLHALESHPLTPEHVVTVARTVAEGIDSARAAQAPEARRSRREAWAGLEEAIGEALQALERAARELAACPPRYPEAELAGLRAAAEAMAHELVRLWQPDAPLPGEVASRAAAITAHLSGARPCVERPEAGAEMAFALRAREHFLQARDTSVRERR